MSREARGHLRGNRRMLVKVEASSLENVSERLE